MRKPGRWRWNGVLRGGVLVIGSIDALERSKKVVVSFRECKSAMTRITATVIRTIIKKLRLMFETTCAAMMRASVSMNCEPETRLRNCVMYYRE